MSAYTYSRSLPLLFWQRVEAAIIDWGKGPRGLKAVGDKPCEWLRPASFATQLPVSMKLVECNYL